MTISAQQWLANNGAKGFMKKTVTNVVFAGLGGQGVVKASDILAEAVFRCGYDVKKAEVHGMSQRGGFVASEVRFGETVMSPMIPDGEVDYLVVMAPDQAAVMAERLKPDGILINIADLDLTALPNKKAANVAILGALSRHLPFSTEEWFAALKRRFPAHLYAVNQEAFCIGKGGRTCDRIME